MKQEQITAAVERFFEAVTKKARRADLYEATRGLLEALTAAAQEQVTQAALILLERLDDHERRLSIAQRRIEAAERAAEGASRRADQVAHLSDARIDRLYTEQLDPKRQEELLIAVYRLGVQIPAIQEELSALRQRIMTSGGGDATPRG